MKHRVVRVAVLLGKLLVVAVLFEVILRKVDFGRMLALGRGISWGWLIPIAVCMLILPVVMAYRLSHVGALPARPLVRTMFEAFFFNNFLPAQFGGDVYKTYRIAGLTGNFGRSLAAVTSDRIVGMVGTMALALGNVALGYSWFPDRRVLEGIAIYLALVVAIILVVFLVPESWLRAVGSVPGLKTLPRHLSAFRGQTRLSLGTRAPGGIALTLASHGLLIAVNILAMHALRIECRPIASLLYLPIISVAVLTLPISINGLGVRETLFVWLFPMAGYTYEQSLAMAIIQLAGQLVPSLVGGGLLLAQRISQGKTPPGVAPAATGKG